LGVEDRDVAKLDSVTEDPEITSYKCVAGNIRVAPDTDPSTHRKSTGGGRSRLLGVENRHIAKLDRTSGDGQVASHERVAGDIRVAPDTDPSGHCQRASSGRPRLLGIENRDIPKLDGASGHRKIASHESVAADISVASDPDPSGHGQGARGGGPRLLGVENGHIAILNRVTENPEVTTDERITRNVRIAPYADPSTHGQGARGGGSRLLGVENGDIAVLNRVTENPKVTPDEGVTRNIGVSANTDAATDGQGARGGGPGLLGVENSNITKLDGITEDP